MIEKMKENLINRCFPLKVIFIQEVNIKVAFKIKEIIENDISLN